jgi:siderophore synthetase component
MITDEEICMPLASIFIVPPISHTPIIVEAMENSGVNGLKSAKEYFKTYSRMILAPMITLLVCEGINFEGHQ